MGKASTPFGKRLALPEKISATWLMLKLVIRLLADTTATTSALATELLEVSAMPMATNPMRLKNVMNDSRHFGIGLAASAHRCIDETNVQPATRFAGAIPEQCDKHDRPRRALRVR